MNMNFNLISRAAAFAAEKHEGHVRKYTGEPYFNHLSEVAGLVRAAGLSSEAVAAAYLHDTLEDTDTTADELRSAFGDRVTDLVVMLTDVSKPEDGNRKVRKALDREHLATADYEGKSVKLADLISNTDSIVTHDPKFAKVYLAEKALLLEVLTDAHPGLFGAALRLLGRSVSSLD